LRARQVEGPAVCVGGLRRAFILIEIRRTYNFVAEARPFDFDLITVRHCQQINDTFPLAAVGPALNPIGFVIRDSNEG